MAVSNFCRKLRYLVNSHSYFPVFRCNLSGSSPKQNPNQYSYLNTKCFHSRMPCDSSTGYSSFCATTHPFPNFAQSFLSYGWCCSEVHVRMMFFLSPYSRRNWRMYSSSADPLLSSIRKRTERSADKVQIGSVGFNGAKKYFDSKQASEIVDLVKKDTCDLEDKLGSLNVILSKSMVISMFQILTSEKVPILRFFEWIRTSRPDISRDSEICSLVVDNCGRLDDHVAMTCILNDFNVEKVCLTPLALGFLRVLTSDKESIRVSVKKMMITLKNVGGSCKTSGIRSMIEMFSIFGHFDLTEYVIENAGGNVSHYNVLVKGMCMKGEFQRVENLLIRMREHGCDPNTQTYNYIISGLCRRDKIPEARQLLEDMEKQGPPPNALTFDILIHALCRHRDFDIALQCLDDMVSKGIKPRLSIHAAFIKGYFISNKCDKARDYVVQSCLKHASSSNKNYSLLATLYDKRCNTVAAQKILMEMMEKGLRPNLTVYRRIKKHLLSLGKQSLASDLESRFFGLARCRRH